MGSARTIAAAAARACAPAAMVFAASTTWTATAAAQKHPAQMVHRSAFTPVDSSGFSLLTAFFDFDRGLPLDARMVDGWEAPEARFEKVVFTTQSGERVPGDLALPRGTPPFPCVLLLHGLGNDRDRWWQDDRKALPVTLLADGIAVLTIDLRFHGERTAANDYQSPIYLTMGDSLFVRNRDMVIQSTIDARRALEYLRTRPDIEVSRLGVMGYSMGAMIALILPGLDEKLAAVVAAAVPMGEQPPPIDPFNFAPRDRIPTLLQVGLTDWLSSPEDAKMLRDLLPAETRELVFYDAGHQLPTAFASDAAGWLAAHLR